MVLAVLVEMWVVELVLLVVLVIGAELVESFKPLLSTDDEFDDSLVVFSTSAEYGKLYKLILKKCPSKCLCRYYLALNRGSNTGFTVCCCCLT